MNTMERIIFVGQSSVAGAGVSLLLVAALSFFFLPSIAAIEAAIAASSLVGGVTGAIIASKS